jgi:hypothetical protein
VKITRIRIVNYMGIESLDTRVAPAGMIVCGTNGAAKTSVLRAIQAALAATDIGPDAIRKGATKAEILIDLDKLEVRRAITPKGSQVSVSQEIANGVMTKLPSPTSFLRDLLGVSSIDPLDLMDAKTAEDRRVRRARILAAIPARVTAEQIERWIGEPVRGPVDQTTHGLEIVAGLRRTYYERRAAANAVAKESRRRADDAAREIETLARPENAGTEESAEAAVKAAMHELSALRARAGEAERAARRSAETRTRVQQLRILAEKENSNTRDPDPSAVTQAEQSVEQWKGRVKELEIELAEARESLFLADECLSTMLRQVDAAIAARQRATDLQRQADDLAAAVDKATVPAPSDGEILTAQEKCVAAERAFDQAKQAAHYETAVVAAHDADVAARALEEDAGTLDGVVRRLTDDAPAEVFASSDGIPGLSIDGDKIFLDGVSLDGLCGKEQLQFAVEIARRANSKSRILMIDGLERVASDQIDDFVRFCTRDGWQLLATIVADGERTINAISLDDHGAAAQ